MDGILEGAQNIVYDIFLNLEMENMLLEDILLDGNDGHDDDDLAHDVMRGFEELEAAMPPLIGQLLWEEIQNMEVEEDEMFQEILYGRNDRAIDWRLGLPRMEYLRSLEDPTFRRHFRMDRIVFEALIVTFGNHLVTQDRLTRLRTEVDKCLLMSLWILFNLDTFRATGVTFGVSQSVIHFHYLVTIEALRELAPRFIKWPSVFERAVIKQHFERKSGYPGIVGALDGILIRCYAPTLQRERYFDRHHAYSINVQAICDHNMLYRDIYVGEPGSVNDNRVFQKSPIYNVLLESEDLVKNDEHIIGDGGYECFDKLITPFRNAGHFTPAQRRFNCVHSSNRMVIERSFGLLRGKMRRLLKLYIKRFEYLMDHLVSSFVIHNFILLEGNEADGICVIQPQELLRFPDIEDEDDEDAIRDGEDEDAIRDGEDEDAIRDGVDGGGGGRRDFGHPLLRQAKLAGNLKRNRILHLVQEDEEDHN